MLIKPVFEKSKYIIDTSKDSFITFYTYGSSEYDRHIMQIRTEDGCVIDEMFMVNDNGEYGWYYPYMSNATVVEATTLVGVLTYDQTYYMRVRTACNMSYEDLDDESGTIGVDMSEWSDEVAVQFRETGVITFTTSTNPVTTKDYTFIAKYDNSSVGCGINQKYYYAKVFDASSKVVYTKSNIYQLTGNLTCTLPTLENYSTYTIKFYVVDQLDRTIESSGFTFALELEQSSVYNGLTLENIAEEASVAVTANIKRLMFDVGNESVCKYVTKGSNTCYDFSKSYIYLSQSISFRGNFTFGLWLNSLPKDGVVFFEIKNLSTSGNMRVYKETLENGNYNIICVKNVSGFVSHNEYEIDVCDFTSKELYLQITCRSGRIDINAIQLDL